MSEVPRWRIVHVVNDVHMLGNGIVNVAVDLACRQRDRGHEVWVLSAGGAYEDLLRAHGVIHTLLDQRRSPAMLLRAARGLDRCMAQIRPDVVHAHMMTGALLARGVRLRHRYTLICTVHNDWQRGSSAMVVGDRVIAVSTAVATELISRRMPAHKIRVVPNGPVASPRDEFRSEVHVQVPALLRPSIVTVAGMYERKGIRDLIDAFARLPHEDAHLYLVGDGPDRIGFELRAAELGIEERVHFERFQERPRDYLRQADVFVLASRQEPISLVVPEARAEGCAIVASDAGGIVEALDGGRAGRLFPAGDVTALAGHLDRVLSDPSEQRRLRTAAKSGSEWFSVDRMTTDTLLVYEEALCMRSVRRHARTPGRRRSTS